MNLQLSHNCISKNISLHKDFNIYTKVLIAEGDDESCSSSDGI